MQDAALFYTKIAKSPNFDIPNEFVLATIHRAENTDDLSRLKAIFEAYEEIAKEIPIILPLHPRTANILEREGMHADNVKIIEPVGYLEMVYLLEHCKLVMTDSGGLQKEAFFFKKPCITLRDETEWVELVSNGFNTIVGADKSKILEAFKNQKYNLNFDINLYGNGAASGNIIKALKKA